MTGRAFEVVSNQLKNGGAIGDDGHKYLFLTPQELSNFNSVSRRVTRSSGSSGGAVRDSGFQ
eukprot:8600-Eustigmatos_ZCMA.PRE.1